MQGQHHDMAHCLTPAATAGALRPGHQSLGSPGAGICTRNGRFVYVACMRSEPVQADPAGLRAVLYTRVSTAEQGLSGGGLPAQAEQLDRAAEARGWQVIAREMDMGVSGKSIADRPGLQMALARA